MTREFKEEAQLRINVYFKPSKDGIISGEAYLAKDIPQSPFGNAFEIVSFWADNKLMVFPMDMIDHCELYEV